MAAAVAMVVVITCTSLQRRIECERRRLRFVGGFGFMISICGVVGCPLVRGALVGAGDLANETKAFDFIMG